jgi:hypothetical protein
MMDIREDSAVELEQSSALKSMPSGKVQSYHSELERSETDPVSIYYKWGFQGANRAYVGSNQA